MAHSLLPTGSTKSTCSVCFPSVISQWHHIVVGRHYFVIKATTIQSRSQISVPKPLCPDIQRSLITEVHQLVVEGVATSGHTSSLGLHRDGYPPVLQLQVVRETSIYLCCFFHLIQLPLVDTPEIFGMYPNTDIT